MHDTLKLLLLEDNPADAELQLELLRRAGMIFESVIASDEEEFHLALNDSGYHAVLADNSLPQYSSVEALKLIRATNPHVAFILVTGTMSEEFAVSIIQQGADDYILKTNLTRLPAAINNAVEKKRIQQEKARVELEVNKEKELSLSIINSLPGIFFLCDNRGGFLKWNRNFERISGYRHAELQKMNIEYFITGPEKDSILKFMQQSMATGHGQTEASFLTRSGKKIPYFFTSTAATFEDNDCLICVGLDISASKEGEAELKQINAQLRSLSARIQHVREEERTHIAHEIHDELGQHLTILKMDVNWIGRRTGEVSDPEVKEKLSEMNELLDVAIGTVRKVATELRPMILDDMGLIAALEWQGREFEKRFSIPVRLNIDQPDIKLTPDMNTGLFRLVQESLTNIARHAEATLVTCSIDCVEDRLELVVEDDGKGFHMNEISPDKSFGLLGMKERVLALGGELTIQSETGKGTRIGISVPLRADR
jgi:PAS domain S-box-containing protein